MAKFNFGDIVSISGYWPRVFKIDGYRNEEYHYPGETWSDIVYELIDAHCSEWVEADEEDLTLIAPAHKADEYLKTHDFPIQTETPKFFQFGILPTEGISMAKPERKPTARELSAKEAEERKAARKAKAEEIDILLDMRNWYADQFAKTANVEDNERVLALDCKLKELANQLNE